MPSIKDIEGIGASFGAKLKKAGISTTEALLKQGATPKGREELSKKSGIGTAQILKWVNHADLFRVKGVGPQYAELLEAAGVDSIPELAQRKPENLILTLEQTNKKKKLVRNLPVESQVKEWVGQAKKMSKLVKH